MPKPAEHDPYALPEDLPPPVDDGACDHLPGRQLPSVPLPSTDRGLIDLAALPGRFVIFCFPRAGQPGRTLPTGWNEIPGARGCTPQSLTFRDHYEQIRSLHADVVGISTQAPEDQQEIATRLELPFPLLSDAELAFARALELPTLEVEGTTMLKRATLIVTDGLIEKVFYPVFPPNKNADEVIVWLLANHRRPTEGGTP